MSFVMKHQCECKWKQLTQFTEHKLQLSHQNPPRRCCFCEFKKQVCHFSIFRWATKEKPGPMWPHRSQRTLRFESVVENDQYTWSFVNLCSHTIIICFTWLDCKADQMVHIVWALWWIPKLCQNFKGEKRKWKCNNSGHFGHFNLW